MASERIVEAVMVTAELTGTQLSEAGARVMLSDLSSYPEAQVLAALTRCRKEVRTRLTIADVIARLEDGRPGPEEAWAMLPKDEAGSVVWTEEMAAAYGVAYHLFDNPVQARMAFLESYRELVRIARDNHWPPKWRPSLGHDVAARAAALEDAVAKGRLGAEHALQLAPGMTAAPEVAKFLAEHAKPKQIEAAA